MSDAELALDALRLESMRTHVAVVKCEPANGLLEIGVHVELAHEHGGVVSDVSVGFLPQPRP